LASEISKRVYDEGARLVGSATPLSLELVAGLNRLLGTAFAAQAGCVLDSQGNKSPEFAAIVHTAVLGNKNSSAADGFHAEDVAVVVECVPILDISTLQNTYTKIAAAKAIVKIPRRKDGTVSSDRTLGMIVAKSCSVSLDDLAEELDRLNQQTASANWPDMIAVLDSGTINYAVQFPGGGVLGDHMPPAADVKATHRPPMYIVMALKPTADFTFSKFFSYLVAHLSIFAPAATIPKWPEILEGVTDRSIILSGYQWDGNNQLVPVPPEFRNDRYIPPPPFRIEGPNGDLLAFLQYLQWKDGGVLMLKSMMPKGGLPLEGLMIFLGKEAFQHGGIVRSAPDTQLSNVLPINQQHFQLLLQRIQKQTNMRVQQHSPDWTVQKFADEGSRSAFMTRLFLGIPRLRDLAFSDRAAVDAFDRAYEFALTTMLDVRTTAREIETLIKDHLAKVESGEIARSVGNTNHIDESIDRELRTKVEAFLVSAARVLKKGMQEYAVHLGPNIGFLFKKDQTFETELAKLRVADPLLAEYLKAVRSWSETLQLTRNGIEHATWVPPKMAYRRNGHRIEGVEPELCGMPVTVYVALVTDRLACFIEEFSAHCLQNTMPTGTCLTEIPLSRRVTDLPERFHITPAKGGLPRWVLVYHNETFDEV
jgi:hypothetical protein